MTENQFIVAQTNHGPVRGLRRSSTAGQTLFSFHNIPYAQPPVGELRFKAPQPWTSTWSEVRDATAHGTDCFQADLGFGIEFPVAESEDCLQLNVYTCRLPTTTDAKPLPVIVMIHGGGLVMGSCSESMSDPGYLLEHDIVYVCMNYRLNVLGFLSIADPAYDIPGNAGLKDQAMAMRWVRQNVQHFGGDAANVTLMGLSGGAAAVHYHLISERSRGLFDRAIVQSGSALCAWASQQPNSGDLNERLARAVGWSGEGGQAAMLRTLLAAPAKELALRSQEVLTELDHQNGRMCAYVPIVEPYDNGTQMIGADLRQLNRQAWSHRIPIIVGGTTDEGFMYNKTLRDRYPSMFADMSWFENSLPRQLELPADGVERKRLGAALRRFYYGAAEPSFENFRPYIDLLTEKMFWHGLSAIVKARVANSQSAPTYLYNFDFRSTFVVGFQSVICGGLIDGVSHGDDVPYHFRMPGVNDALPEDSAERRMRVTYNSLLTSFAATGKPTSEATLAANIDWKPVEGPAPFKCLNLGNRLSICDLPNSKRVQFWDSLCDY